MKQVSQQELLQGIERRLASVQRSLFILTVMVGLVLVLLWPYYLTAMPVLAVFVFVVAVAVFSMRFMQRHNDRSDNKLPPEDEMHEEEE